MLMYKKESTFSTILACCATAFLSLPAYTFTYDDDMQARIAKKIVELETTFDLNKISVSQNSITTKNINTLKINKTLRLGDTGDDIAKIVAILATTGDIAFDFCKNNISKCTFDHIVKDGVKRFQIRHGVKADGIVGSQTLTLLNQSPEQKLNKLKYAFNQIEHLRNKLGDRYILVNIPAYTLKYVNNYSVEFTSRVIVGKSRWQTPTMSDEMEYFVVNPYWRIPASIYYQELVPKIKQNPQYLDEKNIKIYEDTYLGDEPVDPNTVNWDSVVQQGEFYYATQFPNKSNPMGRVKYIFPNREAIYIHDTAARGLFDHNQRAFSHGCIRIEQPYKLAQHVLNVEKTSPQLERVYRYFRSGQPTKIYLPEPLPVHLTYIPAWVTKDGKLHTRKDIYNHTDKNTTIDRSRLVQVLNKQHAAKMLNTSVQKQNTIKINTSLNAPTAKPLRVQYLAQPPIKKTNIQPVSTSQDIPTQPAYVRKISQIE